jgi:cation transport ATPase-like protein
MTRLTLAPQAEHVGPAPPATVGLSSAEAQRRLTEFGPNEIRREQATNALTLLVRQFASPSSGCSSSQARYPRPLANGSMPSRLARS